MNQLFNRKCYHTWLRLEQVAVNAVSKGKHMYGMAFSASISKKAARGDNQEQQTYDSTAVAFHNVLTLFSSIFILLKHATNQI